MAFHWAATDFSARCVGELVGGVGAFARRWSTTGRDLLASSPSNSSRPKICKCGRARPSFGFAGDAVPSCCGQCKTQDMMRLRGSVCSCGKAEPCFGMPGDARPTCCAKCKTAAMVDIKHRKCTCGKTQPFFGMPGDARPTCCAKCKAAGMVDIVTSRCKCGKSKPHFGMPGDARPSCCAKCKTAHMVLIGKRACKCGKTWAAFGLPGDARASCCAACKTARMVDIVSPKCFVCGKRAVFPDALGKQRQLCALHSAEVGAHVLSSPRYSRASNDCLDVLEEETGHEFPFRYRLYKATGTWSGSEFAGLIPGRALRPDAYHPENREIVEFLGIYYHGFPPDHPQHSSFLCVGSRPAMELYQETMARLDLFAAAGLRVSYVWEHEFTEWQRAAAGSAAPPISSILRAHIPASPDRCRAEDAGRSP